MKFLVNRRLFCTFLVGFLSKYYASNAFSDGRPFRDRFQSYRQTFRVEPDKEEAERIVKNIIKGRKLVSNLINLETPDIAEDGNVVPIKFSINCNMSGEDYPKSVHVLGLENPFPEIAIYHFFPESGKAEVSFRCRLRKSSYLMVIADMQDGSVGMEKKYIDVMLGACS